jgi:type IV pilus assembly protein PilO
MELSLNKLQWYGQVGAFVAISLVGLAGFYFYYAAPEQAAMATQRAELEQMRADINRGLAIARQLPEFEAQVADLEGRLDSLRAVLPEQQDVGDLLRRVQTLATQSSLTIRAFTPQPIVTQAMHIEWPISLQLGGTYHNLGEFFDRISKFSRIINVSNVNIRANEDGGAGNTIAAECTATTFVLLETPAGAAPGA